MGELITDRLDQTGIRTTVVYQLSYLALVIKPA